MAAPRSKIRRVFAKAVSASSISPICAIRRATSFARCTASSERASGMMRGEDGLLADLDALAIPFAAHAHVAVFTVADSAAVHDALPGPHTKHLVPKDAGGAFCSAERRSVV